MRDIVFWRPGLCCLSCFASRRRQPSNPDFGCSVGVCIGHLDFGLHLEILSRRQLSRFFIMNPNDHPSPLPQPMRNTCRNCGFGWNENTPFCPRCGASLAPLVKQKASAGTMIALGCGFILFGATGACFSLFGFSDGIVSSSSLNPFSFIGVGLLGASLFLLWKLVRGGR